MQTKTFLCILLCWNKNARIRNRCLTRSCKLVSILELARTFTVATTDELTALNFPEELMEMSLSWDWLMVWHWWWYGEDDAGCLWMFCGNMVSVCGLWSGRSVFYDGMVLLVLQWACDYGVRGWISSTSNYKESASIVY